MSELLGGGKGSVDMDRRLTSLAHIKDHKFSAHIILLLFFTVIISGGCKMLTVGVNLSLHRIPNSLGNKLTVM